ncbi:MAG TPA: hypothetical protein VIM96_07470 [Pseudomonadales bacterium]|jgi:hypothetical protein
MFWKRKKQPAITGPDEQPLYECNPADLDLEMLHHLQAGLTAKLLMANREIVTHYEQVLTQAGAESLQDTRTTELAELTERLKKINVVLESELARFQKGFTQPTRH